MFMWPFNKKQSVDKILGSYNRIKIVFEDSYSIEKGGMMIDKKLHGYGYRVNEKSHSIEFGIFYRDRLKVSFHDVMSKIQTEIGHDSKMVSSQVFECGVYVGETVSLSSYHMDPRLRRIRFGIMILPNGMYVGAFPPRFYMTKCIGDFYDLKGEKHTGNFDLPVSDANRYGDDSDGGYFPMC